MRHVYVSLLLLIAAFALPLWAGSNPVPFVNQPLVPTSVAPGTPSFMLTVNGTGFVPGSVVSWNGAPLITTFVGADQLQAEVPASNVALPTSASVTVLSPTPGGGSSNAALFTVVSPKTSLAFSRSKITTGATPSGVVAADFNGDGKTDLAVINADQSDPTCYPYPGFGTISIFLGNGHGHFSPAASICLVDPTQPGPIGFSEGLPGLWVGDVNRDGKMDIIAMRTTDLDHILDALVYFGNGDGTFTTGRVCSSGDEFYFGSVALADFDRDGKLDLALSVGQGAFLPESTVDVFLGNGGLSGFSPNTLLALNQVPISAGDFNRDGFLDLIFGEDGIALGNGGGAFTVARQPSMNSMMALKSADFNGDGYLDFVEANSDGASSVWLGHGDGSFSQNTGLVLPTASDVVVADLNGDGKLDLVFYTGSCSSPCHSNTVEIFLGNGDGSFVRAFSREVGNDPLGLTVADFNGDGRLDIAVTNSADNTLTIFLQKGDSATAVTSSSNPSSFGQSVTFTANVTSKDSGNLTGMVSFSDGTTQLGTSLVSGGAATISTATLGVGSHSITAEYRGDSHFTGSFSAPLTQVVDKAMTSCSIHSSTGSFSKGEKIRFTARVDTVAPGAGVPSGSVTFWDSAYSAIILGNSPLVSGTGSLTVVLHPDPARQYVKAVYKGDASHLGCESEYLPEFYEQ